ncbi:FAD/NAD(P)-binding protein [Rhodobacter sp. KR11]|uniref:FAD/NAD(P)-binding protein n=1 Tax=Rhodobacter sp. KR11 TaxID=2974588 RepID=UPI00222399B3|nr:FAD/NAD(P)-binding protein [Rhodobacter sp. KR11]MCW1918129.1 FAD/NAD(P)-binding protein [Rhodobacter sp. KR11]
MEVEPRPRLGAGLANSATDPEHRLNVPDAKMTLRTEIPDDYARWLKRQALPQIGPADRAANGDAFTSRARFGDYVADPLAPGALEVIGANDRLAIIGNGLTASDILATLRAQGPAVWGALPVVKRLRLIRHLRSLWDIHRFRIAPQTAAAAEALTAAGPLETMAARLISAEGRADLSLTVRPRGQAELRRLTVDRVVLATGPALCGWG